MRLFALRQCNYDNSEVVKLGQARTTSQDNRPGDELQKKSHTGGSRGCKCWICLSVDFGVGWSC